MTHIGLLWWRKMLETIRQPVWVVAGLTTPLLYLLLFAPLLDRLAGGPAFPRGEVLDVFMPGLLALLAFSSGMGAGWGVIAELQTGVVERLRVTPASRFALLIGGVLRDVVAFLLPAVIVVLIAVPFGYSPSVPGVVGLLVLLCFVTATTSAWSSALGLIFRDIGGLAAVVTGLQLPLTLLSGVLLPLSLAPGWLRGLAHVDPLYYAVQASRALSDGVVDLSRVGLGVAVIGVLTVVTLTWATRCYRRVAA
ncbi:ABC transporter permease [Cryptosporangium sp. NPDC048952]|uniref:ABC transporter permease n=1 Tax=Cryptosporangium sp. NPDC048952 TaxID=3363961 RepID=UPI0037231A8C